MVGRLVSIWDALFSGAMLHVSFRESKWLCFFWCAWFLKKITHMAVLLYHKNVNIGYFLEPNSLGRYAQIAWVLLHSTLRFFSCEGWPLKKWFGKGRHNFIYLAAKCPFFLRQLFTIALKIGHLAFQVSPKGLLRRCFAVQTPTQWGFSMSRQYGSDGLNPWSSRSIVSYGAAFSFWLTHPH